MFSDEEDVVTSSTAAMNLAANNHSDPNGFGQGNGGRPLDSPSSFFKCMYDPSESLFGPDSMFGGGKDSSGKHLQTIDTSGIKVEPTDLMSPGQMDRTGNGYMTTANNNNFANGPYGQTGNQFHFQQSTPPMTLLGNNYGTNPGGFGHSQSLYVPADSSTPTAVGQYQKSTGNFGDFRDRRGSDSVGGGVFSPLLDESKPPVGNCIFGPTGSAAAISGGDGIGPMRSNSVTDFSVFLTGPNSFDNNKSGDANFNTPDSGSSAANGSNNPKNFVPCKVCGDKASGYHYGVTSCEGCKGFFRRSIQKQIEYRCLRDGKCMVFRLNRNRCQYCRFKKCLAVGMSRDSVRYGRVPKRSRDRMNDDSRVSSMTGDSEQDAELERKQLALYDIILSVSQAHHSNCAYTDDKMKNLQHRPMHFPMERCMANENDPIGSTELLEQQKVVMWETLASHTTSEIQRVVEFAKRIPGFTDSLQDDQLILIKAGFFEVWLVRISRMFAPQHGTVTLADGQYVTRDQLELIYNPDLVMAMLNFSVSFNNLHLNDGEIGLFTAIVLLTADRPSLNDPKAVEQLQEKLIEALKLQLSRSHSSDPQVFPNLLLKLSELRSLGAKHNDVLGWYRMNWRRLKLPPLYAEIYDIPKGEEVGGGVNQPPPQPISINTNGCSLSPATTPGTPGSVYQGQNSAGSGHEHMMMGSMYGGMAGNGHLNMMGSIGPSLGLI